MCIHWFETYVFLALSHFLQSNSEISWITSYLYHILPIHVHSAQCQFTLHPVIMFFTNTSVMPRLKITLSKLNISRSQWLRGLRRGPAAAGLLGLWVRIPPRE